ncbi:MAG: Yip1 family protein [Chitinophagaceae bacterium]
MAQQPVPPVPPPPPPPVVRKGISIVDRAKNILITPKSEWLVVDREPYSPSTILTSYVLPMMVIGVAATFIGQGLIGRNLGPLLGSTASVKAGLIGALLYVILSVITVYIVAATIDVLSESFGSQKNWKKSFELAAYSLTASYIGAIFLLFPALNIIVILCTVYSIYPLYTGIAPMKKTPVDKQVAYLAVIILITIVATILVGLIQTEIIKSINRPRGLTLGI